MVPANRWPPAELPGKSDLWRSGASELQFPANRVWTLGPPDYDERLPAETDLRKCHGIVVIVALSAEDIVHQWESTAGVLRLAQSLLPRETIVAVADPTSVPAGVLVMAERQLPVRLMEKTPPPRLLPH